MAIALDVMGGDHAPQVPIDGALAALDELGPELKIVLVGPRDVIERELKARADTVNPRLEIANATQVIHMTDKPAAALRSKPDSSLVRAVTLLKEGRAEAIVSAGHTGAQMAASYMILGLIEGVKRPTIGGLMPRGEGKYSILLDVGANLDCKPINLLQFGIMGATFMEIFGGIKNPKVALLSIGEERNKGNEQVLAAHYLLEHSGLNFIGNVEGRDVLQDRADVIVCDGFVGNIVLKFAESVGSFLFNKFKHAAGPNGSEPKAGPILQQLQRDFDYAETGGVPLLGVNGISIICHGGSSAKAIKNAIREAALLCRGDLPGALASGIERYSAGMIARGMAKFKSFQERQDSLEPDDPADD